jgi:hypothetical protein
MKAARVGNVKRRSLYRCLGVVALLVLARDARAQPSRPSTPDGRPLEEFAVVSPPLGSAGAGESAKRLAGVGDDASHSKRGWNLVFDVRQPPPFAFPLGEGAAWPGASDPLASTMTLGTQYRGKHATWLVQAVGQRGTRLPLYMSQSSSGVPSFTSASGSWQELSGQRMWDAAVRVNRRLGTWKGATVDLFAQASVPMVCSSDESRDPTRGVRSRASFIGASIGF